MDDQRCSLPGTGTNSSSQQSYKSSPSKAVLQETLKHPPPYPSVVLPNSGGYWVETPGKYRKSKQFSNLQTLIILSENKYLQKHSLNSFVW